MTTTQRPADIFMRESAMEDIESGPPTPNPKKRPAPDEPSPARKPLNLKGTQFMVNAQQDAEDSSNASPDKLNDHDALVATSPARSCSTLTSLDALSTAAGPEPASGNAGTVTTAKSEGPAVKRRKLTPAEKLEKEQEKEAKAREKAEREARKEEEKARRDEERQRKDEEKRLKDVERQKKAEEKEAKKREKELEEEKKAQEKLKKERSQMRLGAFFQAKPAAGSSSNDQTEAPGSASKRKFASPEPRDTLADQLRKSASPTKRQTPLKTQFVPEANVETTETKPLVSDYHRTFLPFVLPSHGTLAVNPNLTDPTDIEDRIETFASDLAAAREVAENEANLHHWFPRSDLNARGFSLPPVRELVDSIAGNNSQVIDLTQEIQQESPLDLLRRVPIKHIQFSEDVRPAYCGTYTKVRNLRVSRNFRHRVRPDTDYDYDSEAEWEEPEEGEDIVSEDEDDADSQGDADEIEGFLDDSEDALTNKRRMITGDLQPESTGLCWENSKGRVDDPGQTAQLRGLRVDFLLPGLVGKSINPFSTDYWRTEEPASKAELSGDGTQRTLQGALLAPPRPPLQPKVNANAGPERGLIGAAEGEKGPITSADATSGPKRGRKPAPKTLSKEDLEEFKDAVVGSTVGKLDLLKGLKSRSVHASRCRPWFFC